MTETSSHNDRSALSGGARQDPTIDALEIARFDAATAEWWSNGGAARWLHKYNLVRVPYIRDAACLNFGRASSDLRCLDGLTILDIGCGGGVLCEPLARLGAVVTGADPARSAIEAARRHAVRSGLSIDYRATTSDTLQREGARFDVVLAMEVIEHAADADAFLRGCADLLAPAGILILSTINRSLKSFAYAIVMAERVLRLLPRGTHRWQRFAKPAEIAAALRPAEMAVVDVSGVVMRLPSGRLKLSRDTAVNYLLTAARVTS